MTVAEFLDVFDDPGVTVTINIEGDSTVNEVFSFKNKKDVSRALSDDLQNWLIKAISITGSTSLSIMLKSAVSEES